jgi:hypothetical protein
MNSLKFKLENKFKILLNNEYYTGRFWPEAQHGRLGWPMPRVRRTSVGGTVVLLPPAIRWSNDRSFFTEGPGEEVGWHRAIPQG